eukprot:5738436-Alexandrium_andersonii.AAC.1
MSLPAGPSSQHRPQHAERRRPQWPCPQGHPRWRREGARTSAPAARGPAANESGTPNRGP